MSPTIYLETPLTSSPTTVPSHPRRQDGPNLAPRPERAYGSPPPAGSPAT
ncbi:MAG: hypothetical protein M5U12_31385 [Verrucomicrobia bacterium]|nr:hypothetical protein [Verrucomicrobiota bacterium]